MLKEKGFEELEGGRTGSTTIEDELFMLQGWEKRKPACYKATTEDNIIKVEIYELTENGGLTDCKLATSYRKEKIL